MNYEREKNESNIRLADVRWKLAHRYYYLTVFFCVPVEFAQVFYLYI